MRFVFLSKFNDIKNVSMTLPTTKLGQTGLTVSRLCLGTMTFGLQTDEETSRQILDTAADAGINFLDTADVYPLGGG
ncbi:aldo/keto reductase, partial [Streptomyces sp. CHB9.2]|uniref:aldo/keto reductase n=1 Tax=Streptomyces sp. CHB9.2 TaxID=2841670 RepID=UPI0038D0E043